MDKELVAQAAQNLRLINILLYKSNLKRFGELVASHNLGQLTKQTVQVEACEANEQDATVKLFRVFVDLGVRIIDLDNQSQEEQNAVFQIEATFQVDYELIGDVEQKALEEFAHFNTVHNVWPFWRQYVFNTANQAGLPCPEIPLKTDLLVKPQ